MNIIDELKWRGAVNQQTDEEGLYKLVGEKSISLYCGIDPTGDSMHIGHLIPFMIMKRFQLAGHHPVILIGGGTGSIGDPSGRKSERVLQSMEQVQHNAECLKEQMKNLFGEDGFRMVNNYDWLSKISLLDFLRDYGKLFNINTMLAKDIVASRLDTGISFTEFSYQILQSIDFKMLYDNYDVQLQIGGADQWGNITNGVELLRKTEGVSDAYGLTIPLMLKADGTKFGKTAGGAVWLDPKKTSPYEFYQFWFNQDDRDVVKYLKYFTFLSMEEIEDLEKEVAEHPEHRNAQRKLAEEVTRFVHGDEGLAQAEKVTQALFSGNIQELTGDEIEGAFRNTKGGEVAKAPINIVEALVEAGVEKSKRQAREDVTNGAIRVNGEHRDGGEGQCITFYINKDLQKLEKFMQGKPIAEQEIGKQLLLETAAYAESSLCRRKILLHYFGEEYEEDNCGNCDNCLNPKKQVEAKDQLCAVLETIIALKEKFKAEYVIDVLLGKETSQILSYQHEDLEVFGSGQGEDERTWNAVIRQALIAGYIGKDIENYGLLKVTKAGHAFLKNPVSFKIVKDVDFDEVEEEVPMKGGASCAVDPELYSILKDLRKKIAKRLELPPYVIFQDPSLEAMATTYPITIEELQNIPGVGAGKAKRYGEEFVKVIKAHVEENEIERPEDLRVRTVANKSKLKVSIIQAIDRKIALDELAESKGLEFGELLDEIEAIVYSGTKINIDYFLHEIMDDEHIDDIFDYFKESESDSLEDAIEEFGMEYSEEEIRLIRIKFLSEMGN